MTQSFVSEAFWNRPARDRATLNQKIGVLHEKLKSRRDCVLALFPYYYGRGHPHGQQADENTRG